MSPRIHGPPGTPCFMIFLVCYVFHPLASCLYENRLCISCQSQELHCVDSPWNGSEQSLIALAATVSLLALSIIISNLPDQIATVCRVDITTSLIAILKPSFHSPPHNTTSTFLSRMASDPNWEEAVCDDVMRYLDVACGMLWALTEAQMFVFLPSFLPPSFNSSRWD